MAKWTCPRHVVQAHATVTQQGGALSLLNISNRLPDLLVITKLLTVLDCYDSEAAATAGVAAKAYALRGLSDAPAAATFGIWRMPSTNTDRRQGDWQMGRWTYIPSLV